MSVVETRTSVWEALAGRAPGEPAGPADPGLWAAVVERLNPARATPALRAGIERADLVSVRDTPYAMLRSPDGDPRPHYLRLTPEEAELADLMDGTRTVARLVAEFARISGRLAPDQVTRVVADLAANRMLEELPVDAFRPLEDVARRPWPAEWGRALLAAARGRRMVVADVDPLVSALYRFGGRWLFTPVAAGICVFLVVAGLALFGWTWWQGSEPVFLTDGSFVTGALVLLGLNVAALACHEVGHALAAKHAGRRVPAAGFLIYFGIPSVFVDTTDVWLAGRRARMLTTMAGPATGLVLAGLAQVVGLFVPAMAGWAFKLAFVWYLHALFNLSPLLPLDGYYLLMDWLEVPHLRARGIAWVGARLRLIRPRPAGVRPPAWSRLDGEGRLIALYGMISVLWLAIAVNLGWRIWTDRVAGVVTGVWQTGWASRMLLAVVVAALAAPALYAVAAWVARRVRRLRARLAERRDADDLPRRLAVLQASPLAQLPAAAVGDLAARATWLRPVTGQPVVLAGEEQQRVFVVADGALVARQPGDPTGTIRQRVAAGGLVGLAGALTGAPATLSWHTAGSEERACEPRSSGRINSAGTTLLSVPASAVASAIGPLPGPSEADRAEAEELFAETPALEALPAEDRMALALVAAPIDLEPEEPIHLRVRNSSVVVGAGEIVLPEGMALRRGTMIGPVDADLPEPVAFTRTAVRLWSLPPVEQLPTLLGDAVGRIAGLVPVIGGPPRAGVHPAGDDYPPLAAPPGAPPPEPGDDVDRHFERRMWWLVWLLVLIAATLAGGNMLPGPAWAEMPTDRALLSGERGGVTVVRPGSAAAPARLGPGEQAYVGAGDVVEVADGGKARLTFRGGSVAVLCERSRAGIEDLRGTPGTRPLSPQGRLALQRGRLLADTATTRRSFRSMDLAISSEGHAIVNDGSAWYSVSGGEVEVSSGQVRRDQEPQPMTSKPLTCGDGVPVPRPAGTPSGDPTPSPTPSATPTATATPTPEATRTPRPERTATPTTGPTRKPTTDPPPPGGEDPPPGGEDPPPANTAPVLSWTTAPGGTIAQEGGPEYCGAGTSTVAVSVRIVDDGGADNVTATLFWEGFDNDSRGLSGGADRTGTVGPFAYSADNPGGSVSVWVVASDGEFTTTLTGGSISVAACTPPAPPAAN
jgi:putative peptide zinc metalloprotease protein